MESLKAWVALIGSLATGALATFGPETTVGHVLVLVAALATFLSTYGVKNYEYPFYRRTES